MVKARKGWSIAERLLQIYGEKILFLGKVVSKPLKLFESQLFTRVSSGSRFCVAYFSGQYFEPFEIKARQDGIRKL